MHTRVIITVRSESGAFSRTEDFGIPWQKDHVAALRHPRVVEAIDRLQRLYPVLVNVSFRDC